MKDRVITTIQLYNYLIIPIQIELDDAMVEAMQHQILSEVDEKGIKGIIIDISMVDILDSYISYTLSETAYMAKMMGCYTIISGMQPHVALTLSQMGVSIKNIYFTKNLESALEKLNELKV